MIITIQQSRESSRNSPSCICVFSKVYGFEDSLLIAAGDEQTPDAGFKGVNNVDEGNKLSSDRVPRGW